MVGLSTNQVITRSGIFVYKDASGKSIREYRPDEEVFKADSLTSIRGMPITDGHRGILNTNSNLDGSSCWFRYGARSKAR